MSQETNERYGAMVRKWKPLPRRKCADLPTAGSMFFMYLQVNIVFGAFFFSISLVAKVLKRPGPLYHDPVWWTVFILLVIVPLCIVHYLRDRMHRKKQLILYENAVCFGKSCVPLADIAKLSPGSQRGIMEKYFPSLEKAAVLASNPVTGPGTIKAAAEARQKLRNKSLTITTTDAKQIQWVGLLAIFSQRDIDKFFELLLEKAPGVLITFEDN